MEGIHMHWQVIFLLLCCNCNLCETANGKAVLPPSISSCEPEPEDTERAASPSAMARVSSAAPESSVYWCTSTTVLCERSGAQRRPKSSCFCSVPSGDSRSHATVSGRFQFFLKKFRTPTLPCACASRHCLLDHFYTSTRVFTHT